MSQTANVPQARRRRIAGERARPNPAQKNMGVKSSDILAWAETIEDDLNRYHRALREKSHTYYLGVKKSSRIPTGIDKIPVAKAQRRNLLRVVAALAAAEGNMRRFRFGHISRFGNPGSKEAIKKTGFNLLE
jgi:hypothetical protein